MHINCNTIMTPSKHPSARFLFINKLKMIDDEYTRIVSDLITLHVS